MANLSAKKSDAISALVAYAPKAEALSRDLAELQNFFIDNGFLTNGSNPIVDADCVGDNAHLTAAQVNAGITAIVSMKLSTANATTLRQVAKTTLLPPTNGGR